MKDYLHVGFLHLTTRYLLSRKGFCACDAFFPHVNFLLKVKKGFFFASRFFYTFRIFVNRKGFLEIARLKAVMITFFFSFLLLCLI